jgi:hypothetical protein
MSDFTATVEIRGNNHKETRKIITELIHGIEAHMKLSMSQPKHGRAYKRGSKIHIASAPGEAPAVDQGFLSNFHAEVISDTQAEIIIPAEYAQYLERGTHKLAARPFIEPAINEVLKRFDSGGFLSEAFE